MVAGWRRARCRARRSACTISISCRPELLDQLIRRCWAARCCWRRGRSHEPAHAPAAASTRDARVGHGADGLCHRPAGRHHLDRSGSVLTAMLVLFPPSTGAHRRHRHGARPRLSPSPRRTCGERGALISRPPVRCCWARRPACCSAPGSRPGCRAPRSSGARIACCSSAPGCFRERWERRGCRSLLPVCADAPAPPLSAPAT